MTLETLNYLAALGTLILQLGTVALVVAYLMRHRSQLFRDVIRQVGERGLMLGLLFSVAASLVTLYYSDVLGLEPCWLCWIQRIFLYPQVVLFMIAAWKRDYSIALYSIALSVIGLGVAAYHHALQIMPAGALPCPAVGVSCAQRTVFEFGYITFPLMAATVFTFLIVTMSIVRKGR